VAEPRSSPGARLAGASTKIRRDSPGRFASSLPLLAPAVLLGLFLGLPVVVLVARSVADGSLVRASTARVVADGLALSLGTTAVSLALTAACGLPLAYALARRRFRGSGLVEVIVDLPLVLPPSVAGIALLLTLGRRGLLGEPLASAGIEVPFTTLAVILAQVYVSAPFFVRSARSGIEGVGRDIEDAARVDGADEGAVLRHITLPLAASPIAAGLVMSWARALGEFGATIMFAGNIEGRTQTLPLVVYGEFQGGDLDASIAAAAILVLAAFGVLAAVRLLHWGRALDLRNITRAVREDGSGAA
jgi:molybdate transport system permease protein